MGTVSTADRPQPAAGYDAVLLDVGGTLVREAPPATAVDALDVELLPGVRQAVQDLATTVRLGAVTDTAVMREHDVRALLAGADLDELLEAVVTSVDVGIAKPAPTGLLEAARRLGVDPARVLYVGDRECDRDAAAAAGMAFVATDRGLGDALERACAGPGAWTDALAAVVPVDGAAGDAARLRHDRLTKPPGSLGRLEVLGARLATIAGTCPPPIPANPVVAVFAGDHGVVASGVTLWPQAVTGQMVHNFLAGGAAINAVANQVGATVRIVDVGVASDVHDLDKVDHRKVRPGTDDLALGPAMTSADALAALHAGAAVAAELVAAGHDLLVTGDMGIGNTTASAALIAAFTRSPAAAVTGRGTGIDDAMFGHKTAVVAAALARVEGYLDPVSILSEVGGLEIAALAGFVVGGAAAGVPVLVDGVIALASLIVADALVPGVVDRCIAGHRSTEPGASVALRYLGLTPLLDLGMRLGEGTGACLAIPVVQTAARVLSEMATFEEAAVADDPLS
jgi:nicotinate-nucleotide--dimethylbenzimidazole phosphoribosyltransferase